MSYRKNQGRYARMIAFWAVALLLGYGCFRRGGLANVLSRWMTEDAVLIDNFPLVKQLSMSTIIVAGILAVTLFILSRILNRPKLADLLIDTEGEMRKVTWPSQKELISNTVVTIIASIMISLFIFATDRIISTVLEVIYN